MTRLVKHPKTATKARKNPWLTDRSEPKVRTQFPGGPPRKAAEGYARRCERLASDDKRRKRSVKRLQRG